MSRERLAAIREFALRVILDPITFTGNPELCAKVAKWAGFSKKGQMHFQATAHISRAAYLRTYLGDELAARRNHHLASSLMEAASFIESANPSE